MSGRSRRSESIFSTSSVCSKETRVQLTKREKKNKKVHDDPFKCWNDENFPQNQVKFKQESCYDFDEFIGEMTHPTFKDKAIKSPYYILNVPTDSDVMYATFYIQHTFANVDILKKKMTKKEKNILKEVNIVKVLDLKEKLRKQERRKRQELPPNFNNWPNLFMYINEDDSESIKKRKKKALRICLDRRIDFMTDCVYDCGDISQTWINSHLDFIIILQILAAKYER